MTTSCVLRTPRRGGGSDATTLASASLERGGAGEPVAQPLGVVHSRASVGPAPGASACVPSPSPPPAEALSVALEEACFRFCAIKARSSPRSRSRTARKACRRRRRRDVLRNYYQGYDIYTYILSCYEEVSRDGAKTRVFFISLHIVVRRLYEVVEAPRQETC